MMIRLGISAGTVRLMGLILLVVGVQMLIAGIGGAVDMHGAS